MLVGSGYQAFFIPDADVASLSGSVFGVEVHSFNDRVNVKPMDREFCSRQTGFDDFHTGLDFTRDIRVIFFEHAQVGVHFQVVCSPASLVPRVREAPVLDLVDNGNSHEHGDTNGQRDQVPLDKTGHTDDQAPGLHEGLETFNPAGGQWRITELVHHLCHVGFHGFGVQGPDASLFQCVVQRRLGFELSPTDSGEFGLASMKSLAD